MKYLSDCSMTYVTHNQLEEKVKKLMIVNSRILIEPENLENFKNYLLNYIETYNKEHPKCKPVKIAFEKTDNHPNKLPDFIVRWNNFQGSNGKHIVEFQILASK